MARIVQHRSNPPYLVVTFVFLFLITTGFAVFFQTSWSDAVRQLEAKTDDLNAYALAREQGSEQVANLRTLAKKSGKSVLGLVLGEQQELLTQIGGPGVSLSTGQAIALIKAKMNELNAEAGLLALADRLVSQMRAADKLAVDTAEQIKTLNATAQAKQQALQQANDTFAAQMDSVKAEMEALRQKVADLSASYDQQLAQISTKWSDTLAQKDRTLNAKDDEVGEREKDIRRLNSQVDQLKDLIGIGKPATGIKPELRPDGIILRADPHETAVYIDIGAEDRVRIGQSFSVYDQRKGVDPDGKGKAKIVIKNVYPRIAECQIIESVPGDPMVVGDLIANVAFDIASKPLFVVEGEFDLNGDGNIDPGGAEQVSAMIAQYGGKLADKVSIDVDFAVLGSPPAVPTKPSPGAPAVEQALWQQKQGSLDAYDKVRATAVDYHIPVLNTNRFLAFVGYMPKK
ncbi:MAG: hypothetical protein HQ546_08150 [Planctomycetes bacterium]|nr:hypothetical protein [Planctomycetota bacterium]